MQKDEKQPIKIAVVGPESTGKSTIAEQLARHFGTVCVPEYAREYCRDLNREYTLQDELNMFYGQLALERSVVPLAQNGILICDTMLLTIKIWCDHLFGYTPGVVLQTLRRTHYDLYLLMDIDLPWVDDPLRDFPHLREHFMGVWRHEMQANNARYQVISGLGSDRFQKALEAVNLFIRSIPVP
ncbi:AAA family ATPase [Parapedobacter deserti]|uniref:AAA family ATPase n=1 Tax=Parapedobacter deserti TaxID=1912957 RepID=A0ABV7JM64_9SPHI